jgi:hypothetical protein
MSNTFAFIRSKWTAIILEIFDITIGILSAKTQLVYACKLLAPNQVFFHSKGYLLSGYST